MIPKKYSDMKNVVFKKLFLHTLLLWGIRVLMVAQNTATITMDFKAADSKYIYHDDIYYTMIGDQATFTIRVDSDDPISSVEALSYTLGTQTKKLPSSDYTLAKDGTITFDVDLSEEVNNAAISVSMTYSTTKKKNIEAKGSCSSPLTVNPAIVAPQYSSTDKQYVSSSASSITIGAQKAGTGGGTWVYSWNDGTYGRQLEFNPSKATPQKTTNVILTVKNLAPDNKTEWFKETISYPIYVYDIPTIQTHSIADKLHFYKKLPNGYWSVDVTGGGNKTEYWWYVNEKETKTQSNQFNPNTTANNTAVSNTVKLVIVTYADDNTELWRSKELFNEKYTVYPTATLSADRLTRSIYLGETASFSPSYNNGGYPNGNVYKWSGDITGNSKDITVKPTSAGTYTYVLQASNNYGEEVWETYEDQKYTLNVYPVPSSVITENIRYNNDFDGAQVIKDDHFTSTLTPARKSVTGDAISAIEKDIVAVSIANRDGAKQWSYSITDNGSPMSEPYQLSNTVGDHHLVITIVNGEGEVESPFRAEYKRSYHVYEVPEARRTAGYSDSYETCGGRQVPLSISVSGGHIGGWDYQWKKDGVAITNTQSTNYTENVNYSTSGDANKRSCLISANATYTLQGKKRYEKSIPFTINYWPEPHVISDFSITDIQNEKNSFTGDEYDFATRLNNTLQFSVARAVGGYGNPSIWVYQWSKDETAWKDYATTDKWESSFTEAAMSNMGNTKDYKDVVYSLRATNYQNGLWADNTIRKTIRIYNRPETPSTLIKKGSGASGTMIATINVSDTDSEKRDYYLVFGYEDAAGQEIKSYEKKQTNPGNTRFEANFSSTEVKDSNNRFFVYALWKYDDGISITSGKRYMDGVDEDWDGSDYFSSTRVTDAETTIIENVPSDIPSHYNIYAIDGSLIKNTGSLKSGIYLFETIANGERTVRKVMVK